VAKKGVETFRGPTRVRLKPMSRDFEPRPPGADLLFPNGRFSKNRTPRSGVIFHARISSSTVVPRITQLERPDLSRDVDAPRRPRSGRG
jgi:hypothetical protein